MNDLRTAAQQALEALAVATNCLDGYYIPRGKTTLPEIEDAIAALRAALAEPVQQGCDHCNHPLYAAIKCRVCGRVTEPVQEPFALPCPTPKACKAHCCSGNCIPRSKA